MYRPSIPDDVTNWKVYDDGQQILDFLIAQATFKDLATDEAEHDKFLTDPNLSSNLIPKLVINLEK